MELRLRVKVQPRARKRGVDWLVPGECRVRVLAPPVEGKANREVLEVLAADLGLAAGRLAIVQGDKSSRKVVAVEVDEKALPAFAGKLPVPKQGVRS
jgi:uncharacterized protein (TIGR00251 family)